MKRNYTTSIVQRGICLFLLVPLILGISISEMRASTQALYRAWDLNVYGLENMAWEYEGLENKEEREEKDKLEYYVGEVQSLNHTYGFEGSDDFVLLPQREKSIERVHMLCQMKKDLALLGMPETELNHVICLDDESMDISLPRADEYQVWYAEADIGQTEVVPISDTENATMLHTGYIINKNMKKGYPLRENLESSGDHISINNENIYLM